MISLCGGEEAYSDRSLDKIPAFYEQSSYGDGDDQKRPKRRGLLHALEYPGGSYAITVEQIHEVKAYFEETKFAQRAGVSRGGKVPQRELESMHSGLADVIARMNKAYELLFAQYLRIEAEREIAKGRVD